MTTLFLTLFWALLTVPIVVFFVLSAIAIRHGLTLRELLRPNEEKQDT